MPVKWSEIDAAIENGGYREGFVAIFRLYEGQETDEVDGRGPVRVTVTSFARHYGIHPETFRAWTRENTKVRTKAQTITAAKSNARTAVRDQPSAVVDAILDADPDKRDEILYELAVRTAPERIKEPKLPLSFDEECHKFVGHLTKAMLEGAALRTRAEKENIIPTGYAVVALDLYERISERQLEAELRRITESV